MPTGENSVTTGSIELETLKVLVVSDIISQTVYSAGM